MVKTSRKSSLIAMDTNYGDVGDMAYQADFVVCAWGCNHPGVPDWIEELGVPLHYLELCKDGITPKHPLGNLSKDLNPYRMNPDRFPTSTSLREYKLNTNK